MLQHFTGFDPDGFSIWWCDYKYDDENTVNYQVMNKVGGFLQRIDYIRKYAFGVMCILKNDQGQFPIRYGFGLTHTLTQTADLDDLFCKKHVPTTQPCSML